MDTAAPSMACKFGHSDVMARANGRRVCRECKRASEAAKRRASGALSWPRTAEESLARHSAVNQATGCLEWTGALLRSGYGSVRRKGKTQIAHRLSYETARGPIPAGLVIDHLCRNRRCINPDHLEIVTHRVNILRGEGASARNVIKTHCPKGHEYTPDNIYRNTRGGRMCRTCTLAWAAARKARLRAATAV